LVKLA